MKENFIELTSEQVKVLVNLSNVIKIQSGEPSGTLIFANFERKDKPYIFLVDEPYDEVKRLMGLIKREARSIL